MHASFQRISRFEPPLIQSRFSWYNDFAGKDRAAWTIVCCCIGRIFANNNNNNKNSIVRIYVPRAGYWSKGSPKQGSPYRDPQYIMSWYTKCFCFLIFLLLLCVGVAALLILYLTLLNCSCLCWCCSCSEVHHPPNNKTQKHPTWGQRTRENDPEPHSRAHVTLLWKRKQDGPGLCSSIT